jgi:hypothetical protein
MQTNQTRFVGESGMPTQVTRNLFGPRSNNLYEVPDRALPLRRHLPAGRALHILDIENLMGGPREGATSLHITSQLYRTAVRISTSDQVVVGANPRLAVDLWPEWKGTHLVFGKGPDGADKALLSTINDARNIASRFDRVVIGSGDGIFTNAVYALRSLGIAVGVVGRERTVSHALANAADFVVFIPSVHPVLGAA